ncbi:MAG TPA: MFS transporter [Dermatophilaceae bacterium]|nr:MFS transporter [Dermatophilaceae bacterium]
MRLGTGPGRWVLAATIVASGLALIDATVVNIALPRMGRELGASFAQLQWIVNGYTLTLSALILLGGSLGDMYGRRRIFLFGTGGFALGSLLCALSVNAAMLIGARSLQGIGGALLTPGSLAIISSAFAHSDRARAIGVWSGLGGIAAAAAPLLGGWLVGISWRWVFLINLPLAAGVVLVSLRHVPESTDAEAGHRIDWVGTVAAAAGLGGLTYALTSGGAGMPALALAWTLAVAGLAGFAAVERRVRHPLVPFGLFGSRVFALTNVATLFVYAALTVFFFLVGLELQVVAGYTPLQAGLSTLPFVAVLLLLSPRMGGLSDRVGPRLPMTTGAVLAAGGFFLATRMGADTAYPSDVLPAVALLGLGLSFVVAPLTSSVLAAAPDHLSGTASAINNAVARTASLLAVAVVPLAAGLSDYRDPAAFDAGFTRAMLIGSALMLAGAVSSALLPHGRTAAPT